MHFYTLIPLEMNREWSLLIKQRTLSRLRKLQMKGLLLKIAEREVTRRKRVVSNSR